MPLLTEMIIFNYNTIGVKVMAIEHPYLALDPSICLLHAMREGEC